MLVWEDVKKSQKFPPCRLQDISVWSEKMPFFCPSKNPGSYTKCTSQGLNHYEKMSKMVVTLWNHSSRQVGYMPWKIQIV